MIPATLLNIFITFLALISYGLAIQCYTEDYGTRRGEATCSNNGGYPSYPYGARTAYNGYGLWINNGQFNNQPFCMKVVENGYVKRGCGSTQLCPFTQTIRGNGCYGDGRRMTCCCTSDWCNSKSKVGFGTALIAAIFFTITRFI
ncbi:hypothetical protein WR25_23315 [Diploscapter pachys]|uniref:UPAR/Ly6 domain-containing protein n=1 Tax=Diploscapter pachys TaxID=2018661 RepID=A0A2A2J7T9_9BILA|nr:hypothetical protein WR25_23315 [Diploscapter pachys]